MQEESEGLDPDAPWRRGFDGPPAAPAPADRSEADGTDGADRDGVDPPDLVWSPSHDDREPVDGAGAGEASTPRDLLSAPPPRSPASRLPLPAATPESADTERGVRRRVRLPLIALLVLIAIAVVVAAITVLDGDGGDVVASGAPAMPTTIDGRWTSEFDREIDDVAVGDGIVVVGAAGGLTVFELATGSQLWARPDALGGRDIEVDRITLVDGLILVQMSSVAGSDVRAHDRATGDELWASDGGGGAYTIADATDRPTVLRRSRVDGRNIVQSIDSVTGAPLGEPQALSSVTAAGRHLGVEPTGRRVAVWSTDRQEIVAGPVDSFDLSAVAPLDGLVVAVDLDGRFAAYDDDGVRTDEELLAPPSADGSGARTDLLGVVESSSVAIVAGETTFGLSVDDGEIAIDWQRPGRMNQLVGTDRGEVGIVVEPEVSEPRAAVVDAERGETIAVAAPGRERLPLLARNGYLVAPDPDADERVLEAFGYDAERLWSLPIADEAEYEVLDGAVVVVEQTPGRSVLTIVR